MSIHPELRVLTIDQAAEMLGISGSTARRLAQSGNLPGQLPKVGRQWRILEAGLIEYLERGLPDRARP